MGQIREPKNKPTPFLYDQFILDKRGKIMQWSEGKLFNIWCWENWAGTCKKKKESRPPSYTLQKNELKMDKRLTCKCKSKNCKNPRKKQRQKNFIYLV